MFRLRKGDAIKGFDTDKTRTKARQSGGGGRHPRRGLFAACRALREEAPRSATRGPGRPRPPFARRDSSGTGPRSPSGRSGPEGSAKDWGRPASEGWGQDDRGLCPDCIPNRARHPRRSFLCSRQQSGRGHVNDPSAGSPTETLLRLLLPLNDQVWTSFRQLEATKAARNASPEASLNHSIGSSDGRCVQRAGT